MNVDASKGAIEDPAEYIPKWLQSPLGIIQAISRIGIEIFSFPFQFYIGKDFFFMLYDEVRYKSISNKINELK